MLLMTFRCVHHDVRGRVLDCAQSMLARVFTSVLLPTLGLRFVFQMFLAKAATCAILAPAGPQRTRVMGTLLRNDRIEQVRRGAG